jgi:hypothetical protein
MAFTRPQQALHRHSFDYRDKFMTTGAQKFAWLVSMALYALCWVLPILDEYIGYEGARLAHREFWKFLAEGRSVDTFSALFEIIFISVGWLANELYLLGLVAFLFQRRIAVRLFALALGIMISWHLAFLDEFPLLVGYWFWVLAGGIAFYLAALRRAED